MYDVLTHFMVTNIKRLLIMIFVVFSSFIKSCKLFYFNATLMGTIWELHYPNENYPRIIRNVNGNCDIRLAYHLTI